MILDSRGANILEAPPNRWIRALSAGELISRIHLQPDEDLLSSGSDLKDFYYFFRSTPARAYRNVLVGPMHPKELCHLHSFRPELLQSPTVYGCLNTLAMGDTQAVELAQACHIGIAAQHQIVNEQNLLSLQKPTPRTKDAVGIVIDDFVVLTKQKKDEEKPSSGAIRTSQMEEAYQKVGLMPNIDKGFRDEEKATYWGADVDGKLGTVRGSLKRAIPVAGLIIDMVRIGFATGGLLQILGGCLISLFLYRRRFLSLMDSIFENSRGRGEKEIFALDGRLKSDLLIMASLLPLAVSNLRADAPSSIFASDASSWGEAGVEAKIPKEIGKEMLRHVLKKSVWVKLLAPAAAWMRSHGTNLGARGGDTRRWLSRPSFVGDPSQSPQLHHHFLQTEDGPEAHQCGRT